VDLEEALKEALLETERARRELAECRSETLVLSALEERVQVLQEAVERDKEEVLKEVLAETLDRVAEALAKRPKPSFAEDERGLIASFKAGKDLVVLRPQPFESGRMFKARVWRAWLDHNVFPLPSKGASR